MKRNVRTKLVNESVSNSRNNSKMETDITNREREYKKQWKKQHKHSVCIEHKFKIGDKVLLKKKKTNKWSTPHEREHYAIIEIHGSTIGARRNSDGRTIHKDASKFKLLRESVDESWRERILHSDNRNWQDTPSTETETIREERNEHIYNEAMGGEIGPDENLHQPRRQARHRGTAKTRITQTHPTITCKVQRLCGRNSS